MINTKHQHKHIPTLTIEIIGLTEKGYKALQKNPLAVGSPKERNEGIIQYYKKPEIIELFNQI